MMDWTDRHCRNLLRILFPQSLLYTEMITAAAVLHGDKQRLLAYDAAEHPIALQLGGSVASDMAAAAVVAEDFGYDEVNINVGCPSDRVQSGTFGACLMAKPQIVAECVDAMRKRVGIPVTVKTRIGIDEMEGYQPLKEFVSSVAAAGCEVFIIHARKAWLQGLSPKENREIPPLHYEYVHRLKQDFPTLQIIINGGLLSVENILEQLGFVDGTMIGRQAYQNPYVFIGARREVFNDAGALPSRVEIVREYLPYIQRQLAEGVYLKHMTRHMLGLFQGVPGAKNWRRQLSEQAVQPGAGLDVVEKALSYVSG